MNNYGLYVDYSVATFRKSNLGLKHLRGLALKIHQKFPNWYIDVKFVPHIVYYVANIYRLFQNFC